MLISSAIMKIWHVTALRLNGPQPSRSGECTDLLLVQVFPTVDLVSFLEYFLMSNTIYARQRGWSIGWLVGWLFVHLECHLDKWFALYLLYINTYIDTNARVCAHYLSILIYFFQLYYALRRLGPVLSDLWLEFIDLQRWIEFNNMFLRFD